MIQVWINRFILQVNPDEIAPEAGAEEGLEEGKPEGAEEVKSGDGEEEEVETKLPDVAAVVRVRIPKQAPEPDIDDEGNPIEIDPATIDWSKADEVPPEDKAFSMAVNVGGQQVW